MSFFFNRSFLPPISSDICILIKDFERIEHTWGRILDFALTAVGDQYSHLRLNASTVSSIRKHSWFLAHSNKSLLCSLTLQPGTGLTHELSDCDDSMLRSFEWGGASFLPIAANFWANSVSTLPPT